MKFSRNNAFQKCKDTKQALVLKCVTAALTQLVVLDFSKQFLVESNALNERIGTIL